MNNVIDIKGAREAPKSARSSMETLIISLDQINKWQSPPFQRPVAVNAKVRAVAEELKRDGVCISGIITLGKIGKASELYVVDGLHRLEAFRISGLTEIIADVRIVYFDSMGEMSKEFEQLNTALRRMRPDDILRSLEFTCAPLRRIRSECGFVGYDNVRRSHQSGPILSMAVALRCWSASVSETPSSNMSNKSTAHVADEMDETSSGELIRFLHVAHVAWGRDPEYYRLWGTLNFTLCMWLWRRLVIDKVRGVKRFVVLSESQFRQCMMSVSADPIYVEWLQGRIMCDRDRSPAYSHLKRIFAKRLQTEGMSRPLLPAPAWAKV